MPTAQNIPTGRRAGPRQAYLNRSKFEPYKHCPDRKPDASFLRLFNSLCCPRCTQKLQWKIDYAKYLPLERPRKCNLCHEKTVVIAYHHICQECSRQNIRCAKCQRHPSESQCDAVTRVAGGDSDDATDSDGHEGDVAAVPSRGDAAVPNYEEGADNDTDDEELKALKGLDLTGLRSHKRRVRALEAAAERATLRERERRTALRKQEGCRDDISSDEEEL